jgi:hypothetical protein
MRAVPILIAILTAALAMPAGAADKAVKKPPAKTAKKSKKKEAPPGPHDGLYRGALIPAPALSKRPCGAVPVPDFEIDRGKVVVVPGIVAFEGTVTAAGFLSGAMRQADDTKVPIQGRITKETDGVHIRAGLIDDAGGCAWTMDLRKQ